MSLRPASRPRPDKEKIKVQVLQKVFFDGNTQNSSTSIGMPTIRCSEPYSCAQCGKAVVDVNMDSDSSMLRTLLSEEFSGFKFRESFFLMGAGLADFSTTTQRRRHQGCRPSAAQHLHQCVRILNTRVDGHMDSHNSRLCETARPGVCPWVFGAPRGFFSASVARAPHRWVDSRRLLATPSI